MISSFFLSIARGAGLKAGVKQLHGLALAAVLLLAADDAAAQTSASGSWLYFNNVNGYAYAPHDPALNAYPLTLMAWFKVSGAGYMRIVDKNYYGIMINSQGSLQGYYFSGVTAFSQIYDLNYATNLEDGQWHHVAMVVDGNGGRLYLDGIKRDNADWMGQPGSPPAASSTNDFLFGSYATPGFQLDEVSVWQKAFTDAEISSQWQQTFAGNEANLVSYWRFNETSGPTSQDSSGHGHTAIWFPPGVIRTNPGYNLKLSAPAGDYAQVAANVALTPNLFTLEAWVNPSSASCGAILARGDGANYSLTDYIFIVGYDGATCGVMKLGLMSMGAWDVSVSNIPTNTWTHVAVTFDGANKRFYINGVLDRTTARPGVPYKSGQPLTIGRQGNCGCSYFDGKLEEVRLWNTVRTQAEIRQNMNRSLSGNVSGLVACYPFDEGADKIATDATGHGYNGTLFGSSTYPWAFTTAPLGPPDLTTPSAGGGTTTSVTLNGLVHPKAQDTRAWFQWGLTTSYGSNTAPVNPGTGYAFGSVNATLTNLLPGTFYHYRLIATNGGGTNISVDQTFRTVGNQPTIVSQSAVTPTPFSIQYLTAVNPNQVATTVWLQWGPTNTFVNSTPFQIGSGSAAVSLSNNLNGLLMGSNYVFRTVASNSVGVTVSPTLEVTTPWPAVTTPAQIVGTNEARLNGYVHPGGLPTTAWFEWGLDLSYPNKTTGQAISGFSDYTNLSQALTGLTVGNIYHYRTVSSNSFGKFFGGDQQFTIAAFLYADVGLPAGIAMAWGDYDNDDRLDTLMSPQLWRNTLLGFDDVSSWQAPGLPTLSQGASAWLDYDNDGRLDFIVCGTYGPDIFSQIWHNTGNGFSNVTATIAAGLPGVSNGSIIPGDYDNDGKVDFFICGTTTVGGVTALSQLWRNTGSNFVNVTETVAPGLFQNYSGAAAWGDYDNDGRLDLLLSGNDGNTVASQIWRNTETGFTNVTAWVASNLPPTYAGTAVWGDYDGDGRLDFLIAGYSPGNNLISQIWHNTGNGFTNVTATVAPALPGTYSSRAIWWDFDNDGLTDLFLCGRKNLVTIDTWFQIWRNTGTGFLNVSEAMLPTFQYADFFSVTLADYDNDGRSDLLIARTDQPGLWRNYIVKTNTPPNPPGNLTATVSNNTVRLNWSAGSDAETPAAALTYNLRVGTAPGAGDVVGAQANATTGFRRLPAPGNRQSRTNVQLTLTPGNYYWSVQTIDNAYRGGPFAAEGSFTISNPSLSIAAVGTNVLVSWPALPDWKLQTRTALDSGSWNDWPEISATNFLLLPRSLPTLFFRLAKP